MPISKSVSDALGGASWIRRMFEEGIRLKREVGAENVADLSLGNPEVEPPPEVVERLQAIAADTTPGMHRYMPNAGIPATRQAVAAHLEKNTGVPYGEDNVVMTVGAGGGLVVFLKALLDPGDEVVLLAPYFVEYVHYIANFGGVPVIAETDEHFRLDAEAVARAITPRTRGVIVNSPNNPTGVVYPPEDLDAVAEVLADASRAQGRPFYLISDEPYRAIAYEGVEVPWPVNHYPDTVHITSFSKDLALPGERIGYVALNPASEEAEMLWRAMVFGMRALGYVNAPAIQQRLIAPLLDVQVDIEPYAARRQRLLDALDAHGFEVVRPHGAFYLFPRVPGGGDDIDFVTASAAERLLVVPGSGFARAGYFRMSYAVTDRAVDLAVDLLGPVARAWAARTT
jgi:aspartate aminotransferase